MINYVRVRTIKAGQFKNAVNFLREYREFIKGEFGLDVKFGTEVGRVGTVVGLSQFENALQWEETLKSMRSNSKYVEYIDKASAFFEDEITEHLVMDLPE